MFIVPKEYRGEKSARTGFYRLGAVWLLAVACVLPLTACEQKPTEGGRGAEGFALSRIVVEVGHYWSRSGGATAEVPVERGALFWENPFGVEPLFGVYVEVPLASGNIGYAPVEGFLRSNGGLSGGSAVRLVRPGLRTARAVSIRDSLQLLRGVPLSVATFFPGRAGDKLRLRRFEVTERDYREVYEPEFSHAVHVPDETLYWDGTGDNPRGGTFVAAWVEESDPAGGRVHTPVSEWLRVEGRWDQSNLYVIELFGGLRIRDRLLALKGHTLVVASVGRE